jgi:hypothetical protein
MAVRILERVSGIVPRRAASWALERSSSTTLFFSSPLR